jgi:biuret amidohydrolase
MRPCGILVAMAFRPPHTAVLALHWQVNVIKPEGFFGAMLSEPVARSGVVHRAVRFHRTMRAAGVPLIFTRFTVPDGESDLVRNSPLMVAVAETPEAFRPDAPGARLIPEVQDLAETGQILDNQKLSGLAGNGLAEWLAERDIDTLLLTGVATNLTVEQTARHASDLGFTVHVVSDCVTAADQDTHTASLANLDLTTAGCLTAQQAVELLPH